MWPPGPSRSHCFHLKRWENRPTTWAHVHLPKPTERGCLCVLLWAAVFSLASWIEESHLMKVFVELYAWSTGSAFRLRTSFEEVATFRISLTMYLLASGEISVAFLPQFASDIIWDTSASVKRNHASVGWSCRWSWSIFSKMGESWSDYARGRSILTHGPCFW